MNKLGLSAEHEENLRRLAAEGLKIPDDYEHFDMFNFRTENGDDVCFVTTKPMKDGCGTAACMIGHVPFLGFAPPEKNETWYHYAKRLFGVDASTDSIFDFMFGGHWSDEKGHHTARACASRILWALEHGVPKNYNWWEYDMLEPVVEVDWFEDLKTRVLVDTPA